VSDGGISHRSLRCFGTALFNVRKRDWAEELLAAIDIRWNGCPSRLRVAEVSGRISEEAAGLTGLAPARPVVGGGGDQAAGAVGNGCRDRNRLFDGRDFRGSCLPSAMNRWWIHSCAFIHSAMRFRGKWHLMGVMLSAGGSLQWYRDAFCQPEKVVFGRTGT